MGFQGDLLSCKLRRFALCTLPDGYYQTKFFHKKTDTFQWLLYVHIKDQGCNTNVVWLYCAQSDQDTFVPASYRTRKVRHKFYESGTNLSENYLFQVKLHLTMFTLKH